MFQTLRNAWKIVDLRKKIFYTLFIILIFRIGSAIAVPFVDTDALANALGLAASAAKENNTTNFMDFLTLMSGGGSRMRVSLRCPSPRISTPASSSSSSPSPCRPWSGWPRTARPAGRSSARLRGM